MNYLDHCAALINAIIRGIEFKENVSFVSWGLRGKYFLIAACPVAQKKIGPEQFGP